MKTINVTFEDKDFKNISKFKTKKLSWRDFIILLYTHCLEAEKRGDFEIGSK